MPLSLGDSGTGVGSRLDGAHRFSGSVLAVGGPNRNGDTANGETFELHNSRSISSGVVVVVVCFCFGFGFFLLIFFFLAVDSMCWKLVISALSTGGNGSLTGLVVIRLSSFSDLRFLFVGFTFGRTLATRMSQFGSADNWFGPLDNRSELFDIFERLVDIVFGSLETKFGAMETRFG